MIAIPAADGQFLSEAELGRMIAQYGDGLMRVCLLYLKDYASAEDAVQETFLRAHERRAGYRRTGLRPWLFAILHNLFLRDDNASI